MKTILELRKTKLYRFLEAIPGLLSVGFLLLLVILVFVSPTIFAVFLSIYGLFFFFKSALHTIYAIYSYKTMIRWQSLDWQEIDRQNLQKTIENFRQKYDQKLNWSEMLDQDLEQIQLNKGTCFENLLEIKHFVIFSTYNEPIDLILKRIKTLQNSGYPNQNLVIVLTKEARSGNSAEIGQILKTQDWLNVKEMNETFENLHSHSDFDSKYKNLDFANWELSMDKINLIYTVHPDGIVGEIKAKAGNVDWAGRHISLFVKAKKYDVETVLVTSLDCDSGVNKNFLQMLSYKFVVTPNRQNRGFQPVPLYSNNFFEAEALPKSIVIGNTIWQIIQSALVDEMHFFSGYSVPLSLYQRMDFWERELVSDDSLTFSRAVTFCNGDFQVLPFWGSFDGDAVVGEDFFDILLAQYLQLRRWAWGAVEGFPYKFYRFFVDPIGQKTPSQVKIKLIYNELVNHFFWATNSVVFSLIITIPIWIGGLGIYDISNLTAVQNMLVFTSYLTTASLGFMLLSLFFVFGFIHKEAYKHKKPTWQDYVKSLITLLISPYIFLLSSYPALEAQIRGIIGAYLGFWVTPKK